jgi:hypothetical protein
MYQKDETLGPEIAVIVVVFPKVMADKREEIERKNSICVLRIAMIIPFRQLVKP